MTVIFACQQAPLRSNANDLETLVSSAVYQALNGAGRITAMKLEPIGKDRTRVVLQISEGDARTVTRVNEQVAQALFGKLNNIVLQTTVEHHPPEFLPLVLCPGSPMFTGFTGRPKPSTLTGAKITLNPGHGWTKRETGVWALQRPTLNPGGSPPVYVQEDFNNLQVGIFVKDTLMAAQAEVSSVRNLDLNGGIGLSGNPMWQEAAKHHLEAIQVPAGVWNSERDFRGSDCEEDKDIRSRPLYANFLGSDVLIGLHSNASATDWTSPQARGTRVYYSTENVLPGTPGSQQVESRKLAEALAASVVHAIRMARPDLSWPDAQVIGSADYGETRFAQMPAVILEVGFHTSPIDGPALSEASFRAAVATGIREGVKTWLGDGIVITPTPVFPAAPLPLSPGGDGSTEVNALQPVVFTWAPVQGATRYGLYISKYPYGAANLVYQNEQIDASSTSLALPASIFQAPGEIRYRWNMTAFNGPGEFDNGSFSPGLNFTLTEPVPAPSVPSPPGVVMSSEGRMLLVWQEVEHAREYLFTATFDGKNASVTGVAPAQGSGWNAAVVTLDLDPASAPVQGKQVCFGVQARNAAGTSGFSGFSCLTHQFYPGGVQLQSALPGERVHLRLQVP